MGAQCEDFLKSQSLDSLINSNLPRPKYNPQDPVAQRWQLLSMSVAAWLLDNISVELYDKIMALPHKMEFADELWDALKSASHTTRVWSDLKTWKPFTGVVAAKYTTLDNFIMEYVKAYGEVLAAGFQPDLYPLGLGFLGEVHVFNPVIADRVMRNPEVARWQYSS